MNYTQVSSDKVNVEKLNMNASTMKFTGKTFSLVIKKDLLEEHVIKTDVGSIPEKEP